MRLVILEAESLGKDMDLSGFSRFGEVTVYEKTTEEECPERVREADIVICNKVRMCSRTLSGAENLKLICVTATVSAMAGLIGALSEKTPETLVI